MDSLPLPPGLEELASAPSLAPRGLIATGRAIGLAALGVAVAGTSALAWGSIERRFPVLRHFDLLVPAHRGIQDLKILHIADLHMYPGQEFLVDFLRNVAASEQVDMVISTGDNLSSVDGLELAIAAHEPFFDLPGAFVLGSNDYYSPRPKSWSRYLSQDSRDNDRPTTPDLPWKELVQRFRDAGWADLSNRSALLDVPVRGPVTVDVAGPGGLEPGGAASPLPSASLASSTLPLESIQPVALMGVDDPHLDRDVMPETPAEWEKDSSLRIGVAHAPYQRVVNAFSDAGADLVLAGHTHGGQLGIPFMAPLVTNCDLPRSHGKGMHPWTTVNSRTMLHVSAGLGTSKYVPFRVATRPEASIIHIRQM
ncbi:MAG: metallophosphoesterase [Actinomycetaceae bacterium]|nr:metallophosphoesterase [Actinomycetaceae bacterium]